MNGSNEDIFREELNRMEMLRPDGELSSLYFVQDKEQAEPKIRIALEQAEAYQADAVFFRIFSNDTGQSPVPQIYIYHDTALYLDEGKYAELHRRLWNAGIPPLVFILTADQIKILNCRQEPEIDKNSKQPLFTPFDKLETMLAADRAFAAREIASGTLWENPAFKNDFLLEKTAYFKLLSHLKVFRNKLLQRKILSEQTVNRLLVMAILVKYLNDRQDSDGNRIFTKGFLRQFSHTNKDDIASLFSEKGSCISFFDHLSKHFNGGIFDLPKKEKEELEQADLSEVAAFLRGDQEPKSGQLLFWPLYSFEDLPVELISNIYEEFLAEKNKGVVYTPPMLVDFLLDQCLPLDAKTLSWKILDPACGSGIFLVGAFKRLIQCWRIANDWKKPSHKDLQKILKNNIFGIDNAKNSEAVLITAFSLCVALCDELDPLVIWNELKFDNLQRSNLLGKDFFKVVESGKFDNHFDLVIGNPPFDSRLTTEPAKQIEKTQVKDRPKLPDTQLALLFLEQSFKVARKDAIVCLIQPAGPLLYNGNALPFRSYLFEQFTINQVFDFTPLEGTLFKAKVAAAAIIGRNALPSTTDKILHLTFRRTKALKEKILFELDPYDFHWVSHESVKQKQYVWKTNLLGGGRLHRMMDRLLTDVPTLGEYLEEKRKNHGWQFGEGYSIGCGTYLNDLPNANEFIELSPKERMEKFGLKRTPKLAPWITGKTDILPKALTRNGVNWNLVKSADKLFFEEPRRTTQLIFSAPHVLIREKVDGKNIPATYSNKNLVFTKQIIGIYAPENEQDHLKVLARRLNESDLFGMLAILVSGRILIGKASSLLKSDIMALPYPDESEDLELIFWEQALVEDIADYLVDFRNSGEKAAILTKADESDLQDFGKMYCDILNPVYKEFRPLHPIRLGSFICYPFCYGDAPQIELPDKEHVVPFLDELLHSRHSSRLFINRILRLYEQNVIFMVKPDQKRYWLRSIALRDADETLIDLLEQGC
ncbi:site-specific DNA-methyltransferase (adenine-specific) [Candidatus Electrothrix laxa]